MRHLAHICKPHACSPHTRTHLPPLVQEEIYCSSYSAAAYLDSIGFDKSKKAYVVGERGIMDELSEVGITSFGGPDDNGKVASFAQDLQHDPAVGAVVCGVDPGLSYYKVSQTTIICSAASS